MPADVVSIHANRNAVELAEELLAGVKSGAIESFAIAIVEVIDSEPKSWYAWTNCEHFHHMLACSARMTHALTATPSDD